MPPSTYRASRGLTYGPEARNQLDVYAPPAAQGAPTVVFYYGGNWHGGARADYLFAGEALASKGFVAVIPDYRLYPEVRFPAFLQDCAQAAGWTLRRISQFGGDPQRVFVMGHSAGAYNAAMIALAPEYLRLAGAAPPRIRGLIGLAGPYDFLPLQTNLNKTIFGFPDTPVATQPIHFASAAAPPSLLVTGDDDRTVDPGNSRRLAARLRERGAQVREIIYPGIGHRALLGRSRRRCARWHRCWTTWRHSSGRCDSRARRDDRFSFSRSIAGPVDAIRLFTPEERKQILQLGRAPWLCPRSAGKRRSGNR